MSEQNAFQQSLDLYFGGSTGSTLGPQITKSYLDSTYSDRFEVGYVASNQNRGLDMGANAVAPNTAFLDFNSLNDGVNDYDTRIISVAGVTGLNGGGQFNTIAGSYQFLGNATDARPLLRSDGDNYHAGGASYYDVANNQGRLYTVRQVSWSGLAAADPAPGPFVTVIKLQDPISNLPWFGHGILSMSNGYSGTGDTIYQATFTVAKSTVTTIRTAFETEGSDLSNFYATITWNAGSIVK